MMKKVWGLVMAGVCAMAIAGCGGQSAEKKAAPAAAPAPAASVLKVGTEATFPPFETYQEKTKTYSGYDIEMIRAVAQNMGYTDVEIVNSTMTNLLQDLNDKKFDVAVRCLAITDNRKEIVQFTDPYLQGGYTVVVKKGYDGDTAKAMLDNKKIAVEKNSAPQSKLVEMGYKDLVEENSSLGAIRAVTDGVADAAVMSKFTAAFYIANGYGKQIEAHAGPFEGQDVPVALAVRKDDKDFHAKLNAALGEFKRTTNAKQLEKTYFGEQLSKI